MAQAVAESPLGDKWIFILQNGTIDVKNVSLATMRFSHFCRAAIIAGLLGCTGAAPGPNLYPVEGIVNFNGKPLADAYVVFIPEAGPRADGMTDDQGHFSLTTRSPKDGTVAGRHKVTVAKTEQPPKDNPYGPVKNLIPERFSSPLTSGLDAEVLNRPENKFTFDLTAK